MTGWLLKAPPPLAPLPSSPIPPIAPQVQAIPVAPNIEPVKAPPAVKPATPAPLNSSPLDRFIKSAGILKSRGFDFYAVLTHAWNESGGFEHIIGNNNFFGITMPNNWGGKILHIPTHEFVKYVIPDPNDKDLNAKAIAYAKRQFPGAHDFEVQPVNPSKPGYCYVRLSTTREFIDWDSTEEALIFYCDKIQRMYPQSYSWRNVPDKYFFWLTGGKYQWATNPKYAGELTSLCSILTAKADLKTKIDSVLV
jgi:hypothetical protein